MKIVETVFIDASNGKAIGQSKVPLENLPQSFVQETTLHLGDDDWQVVKAEPMTAEEFAQTGKLVLTLQKVAKVATKDILYSLPTLCDAIPSIVAGSTKVGKDVLDLHEDDWRQIEFVSLSNRSTVDRELSHIMRIYQDASVSTGEFIGFKEIHPRKQIDSPLATGIPLDQLLSIFPPDLHSYDGLSYRGAEGLIDGGFAFSVSRILFYGQQSEAMVTTLGIHKVEHVTAESNVLQAIQRLMEKYDLCLIDWCRLQIIPADVEALSKFLVG